MEGRIATTALAGSCRRAPARRPAAAAGRAWCAAACRPTGRRVNSSRLPPFASTALHGGAGGAAQLLVVPGLEAGQPRLVAGLVDAAGLLHQLGVDRSDGAEHRPGEVAGGRERQGVADHPGAGEGGGAVGLERAGRRRGRSTSASTNALSPAAATRAANAFGSMSSRSGPAPARPAACSGFAIVVLSIPNRSTGRSGDQPAAAAPRMSARSANAWSTQQPVAGREVGVHQRRRQPHPPAVAADRLAQPGGGAVGPGLRRAGAAPTGRSAGRAGVPSPPSTTCATRTFGRRVPEARRPCAVHSCWACCGVPPVNDSPVSRPLLSAFARSSAVSCGSARRCRQAAAGRGQQSGEHRPDEGDAGRTAAGSAHAMIGARPRSRIKDPRASFRPFSGKPEAQDR